MERGGGRVSERNGYEGGYGGYRERKVVTGMGLVRYEVGDEYGD